MDKGWLNGKCILVRKKINCKIATLPGQAMTIAQSSIPEMQRKKEVRM
jgi:hypothetical protein